MEEKSHTCRHNKHLPTPYKVDFKLKGINVVKPVLKVLLSHHFKFPQNHNYGIETII